MSTTEISQVEPLLRNKNILVTGTTGFVGKVYLEKLLRLHPGIGRVYVLVRSNSAYDNAAERFQEEVLTSSLFDHLHSEYPDRFGAIEVIDGELTEPRFGLAEAEFEALGRNLDLIVNCAASVNFREALDQALRINTKSLISITGLAQRHDIPFLQVSTCYVHGYHEGLIPETIHCPTGGLVSPDEEGYFDADAIIADIEARIDAEAGGARTHKDVMIDLGIETAHEYGFNDTYTLTKWLAEVYLHSKLRNQTLTIVRPAIVESCLSDPYPGWLEGVKVADAVIMAYARGKADFLPANKNSALDIIPVDMVANAMLLASFEAMQHHNGLRIYQVASSDVNPITMKGFHGIVQKVLMERWQELDRLFRQPPKREFRLMKPWLFKIMLQCGLGLAYCRRLIQPGAKSRRAYDQMQTVISLSQIFGFYMRSRYTFSISNLLELGHRFSAFTSNYPVDPKLINWQQYLGKNHIEGLNRYALRPLSTSPKPQGQAVRAA